MNFSRPETLIGRQRCRQWLPLITEQFRLRHLYQILGLNLLSTKKSEVYFTLHSTIMSAPFYTSEKKCSPNPKWLEIDNRNFTNSSALAVVLRIWQHVPNGDMDSIILTWGVNFSGLVYIGNKLADIQPLHFKKNTVIYHLYGGYFTSYDAIRLDLQKQLPFAEYISDVKKDDSIIVCRKACTKVSYSEVVPSYPIDKLRKLHSLQILIKNKTSDVQNIKDKINVKRGLNSTYEDNVPAMPSPSPGVRYAPQLLTMNSLYKMMQDKPTKVEKQKMIIHSKDIEVAKFKNRLLSQERDRKLASIRHLKQEFNQLNEENEERNSEIMDNYHKLNKEAERLKEYKQTVLQHREILNHMNSQLLHRKKQLLKQLLFIYPIINQGDKYLVHGIYLPSSDVLADCSDTGLSVALGYIAHVLKMCSIFLQVPLRYPITHFGSRSSITDNISSLISDRDREFPLYTKGKEKIQFTYAVYLLNKNIAQLRWLFFMHTPDLRATLPNLLSLLSNEKNYLQENVCVVQNRSSEQQTEENQLRIVEQRKKYNLSGVNHKLLKLHSFGSNTSIADPILDSVRNETQRERTNSPGNKPKRKTIKSTVADQGPGLSEILAIPEAYLNDQISSEHFKNYIPNYNNRAGRSSPAHSAVATSPHATLDTTKKQSCDTKHSDNRIHDFMRSDSIEQGTDLLDPAVNLSTIDSPSQQHVEKRENLNQRGIDIPEDISKKMIHPISRSVGSYTDEESNMRISTELGSDPSLVTYSSQTSDNSNLLKDSGDMGNTQQEFLQKWLNNGPAFVCSEENLYTDDSTTETGSLHKVPQQQGSPLTARTDALLSTQSFNLVKPKH